MPNIGFLVIIPSAIVRIQLDVNQNLELVQSLKQIQVHFVSTVKHVQVIVNVHLGRYVYMIIVMIVPQIVYVQIQKDLNAFQAAVGALL